MIDSIIEKPESLEPDNLIYLDKLSESGITNMFGAGVFLQREFGLDRKNASEILIYWMETFSERHKDT